MTTTITAFTPFGPQFPFTGLSDDRQELTELPRSEITFNIKNGAIVAGGGVDDDQLLNIMCVLPVNFAYVLVDIHMQLFSSAVLDNADIDDWDATAEASVIESSEFSDADALWYQQGISNGTLLALDDIQARRIWTFDRLMRKVIVPKTTNAVLTVNVGNNTPDGAAAKVNFQARFLVYDIAQAHHVWVNNPSLVR